MMSHIVSLGKGARKQLFRSEKPSVMPCQQKEAVHRKLCPSGTVSHRQRGCREGKCHCFKTALHTRWIKSHHVPASPKRHCLQRDEKWGISEKERKKHTIMAVSRIVHEIRNVPLSESNDRDQEEEENVQTCPRVPHQHKRQPWSHSRPGWMGFWAT